MWSARSQGRSAPERLDRAPGLLAAGEDALGQTRWIVARAPLRIWMSMFESPPIDGRMQVVTRALLSIGAPRRVTKTGSGWLVPPASGLSSAALVGIRTSMGVSRPALHPELDLDLVDGPAVGVLAVPAGLARARMRLRPAPHLHVDADDARELVVPPVAPKPVLGLPVPAERAGLPRRPGERLGLGGVQLVVHQDGVLEVWVPRVLEGLPVARVPGPMAQLRERMAHLENLLWRACRRRPPSGRPRF